MKASKFADLTILGSAGFFALLLLYSIIFGIPAQYSVLTRTILAVMIGMSLVSLRLPYRFKLNFTLVLISTGLTLIAAEAVLQYRGPSLSLSEAAIKENVRFDGRNVIEVIEELREYGTDAYPWAQTALGRDIRLSINGQTTYPLGGISGVTTVLCNELGEYVVYQSDEHGFNNPEGIWSQDKIEIVSVGDSFIHGYCVPPDSSIVALIRADHITLSLGVVGTGQLYQLALIKEYVERLEPTTVLWFFYEGSDFDDTLNENLAWQDIAQLKKYSDADYRQGLVHKQSKIDHELRTLVDQRIRSSSGTKRKTPFALKLFTLSELRRSIIDWTRRNQGCDAPDEALEMFESLLKEGRDYVDAWGGNMYFVYLPSWVRYVDPKSVCLHHKYDIKFHDQVIGVVESADISVIDLTPVFDTHLDPLSLFPFRTRGHYNEAGSRLVADTILQSIDAR